MKTQYFLDPHEPKEPHDGNPEKDPNPEDETPDKEPNPRKHC